MSILEEKWPFSLNLKRFYWLMTLKIVILINPQKSLKNKIFLRYYLNLNGPKTLKEYYRSKSPFIYPWREKTAECRENPPLNFLFVQLEAVVWWEHLPICSGNANLFVVEFRKIIHYSSVLNKNDAKSKIIVGRGSNLGLL